MFRVCGVLPTLPKYNLVFKMWVNTGTPVLEEKNFVGEVKANLTKLGEIADCLDFVQYQIKLEKQPNGET